MDVVYVPFHISSLQHWVLIVVNLSNWIIDVYDFMYRAGLHNNRVIQAITLASDFIPIMTKKVGLFDRKPRSSSGNYPLAVNMKNDIPR